MEYRIYCDESVKDGKFFSNFYGGVLVRSRDLKRVEKAINKVCDDHHFNTEIKWQKVTANYLDKYIALMDTFFDLMEADLVKVRIMFTQNANRPLNLSDEQLQNEYFILYYHFFHHAFGLQYSNTTGKPLYVRAYFDQLPDTLPKRQAFKEYIKGLQTKPEFRLAHIRFRKDDITEVDSKTHRLLQFLDVVLGSMAFRLNDKHLEKPDGARLRGKRTVAKEKLYKHINNRIRRILPGFNCGISTGLRGSLENNWTHPYRHWLFVSNDREVDNTQYKK
ncbi:DUF3800 domain-containing protein [Hymenobacter metallicola]|uniref:DUF3800 domain-containing protein n=1 Tax=Hymenobacter metallicola TaxID=2563114 RepID=A0A4Z0QCE0_9BACT|nr:DUF3800 domain-containing protein [Hymenobacter metallicola]TGE27700.1 DUF3800 domain-containing protein [Hymenobacter metallicola]